jgi:hypothetical protein
MGNQEETRLDRLEKIVESNARAIQALSNEWQKERENWQKEREEWRKDRRQVYEWMSRLSASQANFWETQADYYRRLEDLEDRQALILDILNRLAPKNEGQD